MSKLSIKKMKKKNTLRMVFTLQSNNTFFNNYIPPRKQYYTHIYEYRMYEEDKHAIIVYSSLLSPFAADVD